MFAKLKKEIMAMARKVQYQGIRDKIEASQLSDSQQKELMRLLLDRQQKCML